MFRSRSITAVVSLALVSLVTVLLAMFGIFGYDQQRVVEQRQLRSGEATLADQLADALRLPAWNFDHEQIDRVIAGDMRNEDIAAVAFYMSDRLGTVHASTRDSLWVAHPGTEVTPTDGWLEEARTVTADEKALGTLKIFVTPAFVVAHLRRTRNIMIGAVLALDLILVVGIYIVLWRLVLGPLKTLELHAAAVSAGDRSGPTFDDNQLTGELERLRQSIATMIGQLDGRFIEAKTAEERYRELVDGLRDVIFALSPDGVITALNPAFEQITGFRRDDWIGKPFLDLLHPDDASAALEGMRIVLDGAATSPGRLYRVRTTTGVYRIGEIYLASQRRDGKVRGVFGMGRDVTDRVHLEDQLRQAQKMEAIGRLAGGVAHDFNNLLTIIRGRSQNLIDELPASNPHREEVEEIDKAATSAAALTRQLLAFSRQQVLQPKVLNVNEVVDGTERLLRRLLGSDIRLITVVGTDVGRIKADAGQLEQVLLNLAVNARDAMPGGGTLTIKTANVTFDEQQARLITDAHPGRYVMIAVSDSGAGMDSATQTRIFEPFFTTKEPGRGTGLGLSTVYGIVSQSGGSVTVSSELGKGTTFTVYLPRVDAAAPATSSSATVAPMNGTETVLLVEDIASVRSLMRQTLERYRYVVVEAADPEAALALLVDHKGPLDLLVTDVVMPGMNGRELAGRLQRERAGLKVLYVSGYSDDAERRGLIEQDSPFLQKPFTPSKFAQKVREVLDAH